MATTSAARTYATLEARLGHTFADAALCETALTHKSWLNESPDSGRTDNERLEFLGDAVIVSESGLAKAAEAIGLGQWIFLGRGEDQAGGRRKPSILSDALEALMGAVYLDGGLEAARAVAERLFGAALQDAERRASQDYKSRLQERSQALLQAAPVYTVVGEEGPDHDKRFEVAIALGGREYGRAIGRSKKEAEQSAAAQALAILEGKPG